LLVSTTHLLPTVTIKELREITSSGAAQPLLLVLEDVHYDDHGTLELLVYVARNLASSPLSVVAPIGMWKSIGRSRLAVVGR
jgi:hypothetical protein